MADDISPSPTDPAVHNTPPNRAPTPAPVKAARALFFLIATIWLLLGLYSLATASRALAVSPATAVIIALLMFGNAAVLYLLGWGVGRQKPLFYYLALLVLAANIFLTVTDEFGLLDFVTLLIDIALLILLLASRSRYAFAR